MSANVTTAGLQHGIPEQRLHERSHVGGVHLQISDLQRSIEYYRDVLGLDALDRGPGHAALGVLHSSRPLVNLVEKRGIASVPRHGRFGLYHFAVLLPDRPSLGRFASHVLGIGLRPGMADHEVSEALYLTDLDGLGIEVYADRPRTSWTYRGHEIVMTTEPLDIASVIAASEGQAWTEAPRGTTMGHVHLHVGNLADAERFYHRGIGFDKTVWSYPGALFLSAGGYHHHLATNVWSPGPSPGEHEARLLEWELIVPPDGSRAVTDRLRLNGYHMSIAPGGVRTADPWGTRLHVIEEERS